MQIQEQFTKLVLHQIEDITMFFTTEEEKETVFEFSQGTVKVL